jgi:hypothetical protein
MDHTRPPQNQLGDIVYFFLINLAILVVSVIIWHLIWIKKHGGILLYLNRNDSYFQRY